MKRLIIALSLIIAGQTHAYQLHAVMALGRTTVSAASPADQVFYWTNSYTFPVYIRRLQSGFFPADGYSPSELAQFLAGYTVMSVRLPWAIGYDKLFMDTGTSPHGSTVTLEPDCIPLEPGQAISIDVCPYYFGLAAMQVELVIWWTAEP